MTPNSLPSNPIGGHEKEKPYKTKDRLADKEGFRHNVYWVTGDVYRGCWSHNKKDGLGVGIHTYKDGNRYEGEWKNGKREGQGTFYVVVGGKYQAIYKGSWKAGRWHVSSLIHYPTMYGCSAPNIMLCDKRPFALTLLEMLQVHSLD
eukprot:Gb_31934 [translate_table: standard]